MDLQDVAERLGDISSEMLELLEEAEEIIRRNVPGVARARAESYWIAQIKVALSKDHGYLAGSMCDMEDTVAEIKALADGEPKDDDDDDE